MVALFLRPDADSIDGNWTNEAGGTTLFSSVDETSFSDTDYIKSSASTGDKVRLSLSNPATSVAGPMTIKVRCKREGLENTDLIGRLYEATSPPTLICYFEYGYVTDSFVTFTHELPTSEFNSIGDFNNLFIEFEANPATSYHGASLDLNFATSTYFDSLIPLVNATITDLLSCSRASTGYAETTAGALTSFGTNTLRITNKGLLVEPAATNLVLWNRDLSNGAWTATNITAAKDQTGPDGVTNSASSILSTAGNATILQSITNASESRAQSAYIKRITGTGTIEMTQDNGSTWTAVTATANWTRVRIPTQTIANPVVGFRIVTSGDKIAVDFVQNEYSRYSSPIATTTTTVTRAMDAITMIGTLNSVVTDADASFVLDATLDYWDGVVRETVTSDSGRQYALWASDTLIAWNGVSGPLAALGSGTFSDGFKAGLAWDASGQSAVGNAGTVVTDSVANKVFTPNQTYLGKTTTQAAFGGYFRRLSVWPSRLSDTILQSLTTP